uniref:SRPBCC domain-containing protein n=1 Tax=Acinetobacter venetianus TaxID=52133 RepID=UPI00241D8F0D
VFLEIIEGEKLVFTDAYTEDWKPSENPFMTAMIIFENHDDGSTKYTAIARHRTPEARQQHEDMGFFHGWGTVVDQLEAYAQKL